MRTMADDNICTSIHTASGKGLQEHGRHLCIARIGLMGMDAHQHHVRLLSGLPDLSLDPGHIRFVGDALDPVGFIQLEFILSKQEGPLRRRILISVFHRILHGRVDLCKSRQACNLVIILLGHMVNGLEAQRIQSRTAAHICALAACHTGFMEGRGDADHGHSGLLCFQIARSGRISQVLSRSGKDHIPFP